MPTSKTKELARKLGVIGPKKKRSVGVGESDVIKKRRQGQLFSYLIVIDFESTCWEKKKGQQEIIEFPAVLLDLSSGVVVGHFQQYVLPIEYPTLSDFCKQLTGITQEQVNNGVPIQTCLYLFKQWLGEMQEKTGLVMMEPGKMYTQEQHLCSFATWSDWDLGVCLFYECKRKQIKLHAYFSQWVNIRALYKTFYERKPTGLKGSLEDLGIKFTGKEHTGIDDARNTAKLCYRMVRDGCKLSITKTINNKPISIIKPLNDRTHSLKSYQAPEKALVQLPTPVVQPQKAATNTSSTPSNVIDCTSNTAKKLISPQQHMIAPQGELLLTNKKCNLPEHNGDTSTNEQPSITSNSWDSLDEELITNILVEVDNLISIENKRVPSSEKPHQEESQQPKLTVPANIPPCKRSSQVVRQTPSRFVSHISPVTLLPSAPTISLGRHNDSPLLLSSNAHTIKETPTKVDSHVLEMKMSSFKSLSSTPKMNSRPCSCVANGYDLTPTEMKVYKSGVNNTCINSQSSLSTSSNSVVLSAIGHKVTPPMCECGRRTKRKLVAKVGPNEGKPFYICPNSSGSNKSRGCGFFKWETVQKDSCNTCLFTSLH